MVDWGLKIGGVEPASLVELPGMITTIVFLKGCNFRCPFCHNPQLVLTPQTIPDYPVSEFLLSLNQKKDWVDLVLLSGGEPTLYPELPAFLTKIKELGFKTGLHTNGSNPEVLEKALKTKALDYLVMDVKSSPEGYAKAVGVPGVSMDQINQSIALVKKAKLALGAGFKVTLVPDLVTKKDLPAIKKMVSGAGFLDIQQFRPLRCLNQDWQEKEPYDQKTIAVMADFLEGAAQKTTRIF